MDELLEILGEELYSKVKSIIEKNTIPKSRFNEINQKLKSTEGKITAYESQIEEAKKLIDTSEDLKNKYITLENQYKNDLTIKDKEISNISKRYELESELSKLGAKHTTLLLKDVDFDNYDKEKNIKILKETYPDLFLDISKTSKTNTNSTSTSVDNFEYMDKL